MNSGFPFFIALRYFFSKKSQRVINVISMISAISVMIGTAALIIVLSVFNGFEDLILRLYGSFDPDLRIELAAGKTFNVSAIDKEKIRKLDEVAFLTDIIEESALARYRDKQLIIKLKGVSEDFDKMTGIDTMLISGRFLLQSGDTNFALLGSAVAYNLGLDPSNIYAQVEIYGARNKEPSLDDPSGAFNRMFISPSGVFAVQQEYDSKFIIVPLRFAREIFEYDHRLNAIEIGLKKGFLPEDVQAKVAAIAGPDFSVKTRYQLHELLYKIMKSEKWAVFMILTFILIIAIFNVISSLTMLVIEKKKDIAIYRSMGANVTFLRKVFLFEGMFITLAGAIAGIVFGLIICFLQLRFGLIELSGTGTFVIDSYPVKVKVMDIVYVFLTVCFIGLVAAWYPARRLIRSEINIKAFADEH